MTEKEIKFSLRVFDTKGELSPEDSSLLQEATQALQHAYAPYSNFKVGAAILLENGKTATGSNQENAAFPAGICAEGTALSVAASLHPDVVIKKIAITVKSASHVVKHPVAPCGICRQRLLEYENKQKHPIEVVISGEEGKVYAIKSIKDLLPLYFSNADL